VHRAPSITACLFGRKTRRPESLQSTQAPAVAIQTKSARRMSVTYHRYRVTQRYRIDPGGTDSPSLIRNWWSIESIFPALGTLADSLFFRETLSQRGARRQIRLCQRAVKAFVANRRSMAGRGEGGTAMRHFKTDDHPAVDRDLVRRRWLRPDDTTGHLAPNMVDDKMACVNVKCAGGPGAEKPKGEWLLSPRRRSAAGKSGRPTRWPMSCTPCAAGDHLREIRGGASK